MHCIQKEELIFIFGNNDNLHINIKSYDIKYLSYKTI